MHTRIHIIRELPDYPSCYPSLLIIAPGNSCRRNLVCTDLIKVLRGRLTTTLTLKKSSLESILVFFFFVFFLVFCWQYQAGIVPLAWLINEIGGKWPCSCFFFFFFFFFFVSCFQNSFSTARSNCVFFFFSFFSRHFVTVHMVHPFSSVDTARAQKYRFI